MQQHPIEGLMSETMEQLKHLIDVKTIIGDPIQTADGSTVIPISRVSFGFVAGGSEFSSQDSSNQEDGLQEESHLPFCGGSGGGVSITHIAFLICHRYWNEFVHIIDISSLYNILIDIDSLAID